MRTNEYGCVGVTPVSQRGGTGRYRRSGKNGRKRRARRRENVYASAPAGEPRKAVLEMQMVVTRQVTWGNSAAETAGYVRVR